MMVNPQEEHTLESVSLSEAEIVPTVRAIIEALAYCFDRFGPSAKEDVVDTLSFKTSDRGLAKHMEKHPEANREFVREALLETIADLELDSET